MNENNDFMNLLLTKPETGILRDINSLVMAMFVEENEEDMSGKNYRDYFTDDAA